MDAWDLVLNKNENGSVWRLNTQPHTDARDTTAGLFRQALTCACTHMHTYDCWLFVLAIDEFLLAIDEFLLAGKYFIRTLGPLWFNTQHVRVWCSEYIYVLLNICVCA